MSLTLVISSLSRGGAERVMAELANEWAARDTNVTLITLEQRSAESYRLDARIGLVTLGLTWDSTSLFGALRGNFRRLLAIRKAVAAAPARTVLSFEDRTNVAVLLATAGMGLHRIVAERTDSRVHEIGRIWALLRRLTYPFADALVVQSELLRPWALRVMLGKPVVHVVPNPLRKSEECVAGFQAPQGPYIAAVGRMVPSKGFDALLSAFAELAPEFPDWRLVIAGDGDDRPRLENLARKLNIEERVLMPGWLEEPLVLLRKADIFVLSSRYEGFPNALLEAMSCGLAVVSTRCCGAIDAITHDVDGLLIAPDDAAELAQATRRFMQDRALRERFGRNAYAASQRYRMGSVFGQWDRLVHARDASPYPKVLFLIRCLDIGGAQRQLVELATGLQRLGWPVAVATFYAGGAFEKQLRENGVRLIPLSKRGRWDVVGFLRRLRGLLKHERPDIVHASSDLEGMLLAAARVGLGPMHLVWAIPAADMDLSYYDWLARAELHAGVACSRFADLVIFNSEAGRRYYVARGYKPRRLAVVPNGVDTEYYRPDAAARGDARAHWGIADEERLVGLVGRLDPMKDHPNFLRAAATVCASRRDVRFVCVGDGPGEYSSTLRESARTLGLGERLIWEGSRADIRGVYCALDLAVSSSLSEGLPNVILEAMATGVPCVVTDAGDSATVVADTGWVCPRGDSAALARTMLAALDALPRDPDYVRERILKNYGSHTLISRTARHFIDLCKSGLPRAPARSTEDAA